MLHSASRNKGFDNKAIYVNSQVHLHLHRKLLISVTVAMHFERSSNLPFSLSWVFPLQGEGVRAAFKHGEIANFEGG